MTQLELFAASIKKNQKQIIERWIEISREDDAFTWSRSLSKDQFKDGIPEVLESLADFLSAPLDKSASSLPMEDVKDHGHERWKLGFDLRGLLRDWGNLRETLNETIDVFFAAANPETKADRAFAHHRVARYFTEASCTSVARFDEVRQAEAASVTEDLENMRRHFEQLQKVRSALLHEASHDIRSGLTAISGVSGLMTRNAQREADRELGDIINESVSAVVEILESFMELNRLEAGKETVHLETFDLSKRLRILADSFQQVAEEKGLTLKVEGEGELFVDSDAAKIRRILQNLLVNAIKYTETGVVTLCWTRKEQYCEVRVIDTGPGLRAKQGVPVACEMDGAGADGPAEGGGANGVLSYEGEGIGLTIVKRLCTLLDIPISLESEPGKGTTFILDIPYQSNFTD